jgi:hypothetical protein
MSTYVLPCHPTTSTSVQPSHPATSTSIQPPIIHTAMCHPFIGICHVQIDTCHPTCQLGTGPNYPKNFKIK